VGWGGHGGHTVAWSMEASSGVKGHVRARRTTKGARGRDRHTHTQTHTRSVHYNLHQEVLRSVVFVWRLVGWFVSVLVRSLTACQLLYWLAGSRRPVGGRSTSQWRCRTLAVVCALQALFYVASRRHIFVCFMAKSAFLRGFSALAPYTGVGPI